VKCIDSKDLQSRTGLSVRIDNVECSECSAKLGRYSSKESNCPCGITVQGPAARVMAVKVDFFDGSTDAEVLAARARLEAETSQRCVSDMK
jgi:hypothetical protein